MNVLVLGGTLFIGRHVVQSLLRAGHAVTLANRGITNPELFADLPRLKIDRDQPGAFDDPGLRRDWDAVIDLSGYFPGNVAELLQALRGRCGRYVFCSTLSVYAALEREGPVPLLHESDELLTCSPEQAIDRSSASYGQRKAECERAALAQQSSGGVPVVILRPAVVFGAHDPTDRIAWWISRAKSERPFILPDDGLTITRRTYAPNLAAAFAAALASPDAIGNAYNIAEIDALNFRDTLFHLGRHLGSQPLSHAVEIPGDELLAHGVREWSDFPLWLSQKNLLVDTYAARRDLGYVSTPPQRALAEAADAFVAEDRPCKAGLSMEAESELLAKLNRA